MKKMFLSILFLLSSGSVFSSAMNPGLLHKGQQMLDTITNTYHLDLTCASNRMILACVMEESACGWVEILANLRANLGKISMLQIHLDASLRPPCSKENDSFISRFNVFDHYRKVRYKEEVEKLIWHCDVVKELLQKLCETAERDYQDHAAEYLDILVEDTKAYLSSPTLKRIFAKIKQDNGGQDILAILNEIPSWDFILALREAYVLIKEGADHRFLSKKVENELKGVRKILNIVWPHISFDADLRTYEVFGQFLRSEAKTLEFDGNWFFYHR